MTNVSVTQLPAEHADLIYTLRWQIELIFKLWKSQLSVDEWSSRHPWRILCEIYAKLLAIVIQHGASILAGRHELDKSLSQAVATVRKAAWGLLKALVTVSAFCGALTDLVLCLRFGGRISPSASSPPTHQKMRALT